MAKVNRLRSPLVLILSAFLWIYKIAEGADPESATSTEIIVTGQEESESLTSPSSQDADKQKEEVPGGFTIKTTEQMGRGRGANFQDLLRQAPGVFLQTDNGTEVSRISI